VGFLVAITPQVSDAVAILGEPVSILGALITLLGAFNEDLDVGIAPDGVHLVQGRVVVALSLVPFLLATIGAAFSLMGLQVVPIGPPVTPIGPPVTLIGVPVTTLRRQVPLSVGIARVGGVVASTGRSVARLTGKVSLLRDVAVQVRSQIASLRRLLTLLCRLFAVEPTALGSAVGEGSLYRLRPLLGDPVPLLGEIVACASRPVTLVGDPVALISHAVTLVRVALALLGLGRHRVSLRSGGGNSSVGRTCIGSRTGLNGTRAGSFRMHDPLSPE
jgi:hypothetical protein